MSMQIRSTDPNPDKRFFRSSDRVFRQSDGWYFSAREGDRGPFRDEQTARDSIYRFLRDQVVEMKVRTTKPTGSVNFSIENDPARRQPRTSAPRDVWRGRPDVD